MVSSSSLGTELTEKFQAKRKYFLFALVWFLFFTGFLYSLPDVNAHEIQSWRFFLYQNSMPLPPFLIFCGRCQCLWMPMPQFLFCIFCCHLVAFFFIFQMSMPLFIFVNDWGILASLQQFFLQFFLYWLLLLIVLVDALPCHQPKVF